jgi:hypothetical protein
MKDEHYKTKSAVVCAPKRVCALICVLNLYVLQNLYVHSYMLPN